MSRLPHLASCSLATVSIDYAASGRGYVVEVRPTLLGRAVGLQRRWGTFDARHTAWAFFGSLRPPARLLDLLDAPPTPPARPRRAPLPPFPPQSPATSRPVLALAASG